VPAPKPFQVPKDTYLKPYCESYSKLKRLSYKGKLYRTKDHRCRKFTKLWETSAATAVAEGRLEPEQAEKLGWRGVAGSGYEVGFLPAPLFHVTTGKTRVLQTGLKSRKQLRMQRDRGLGGGDSNTVSFTTDPELAWNIRWSILEARAVARGEISILQMLKAARRGDGADRPWLVDLMQSWKKDWKQGDVLPQGVRHLISERKVDYEHAFPMTRDEILAKGKRPEGGHVDFPDGRNASVVNV